MSHTGPGGLYRIDITYCDESDDGGAPDSYEFYINGVEQLSWFSSNGSGAGQIWQTESATVNLATGDFISIDTTRGGALSWSRLDYLLLTPIGNSTCGDNIVQASAGETCDDGASNGTIGFCNAQCNGPTVASPVLSSVLITPAGQPQFTVDPQQGFSLFGSAFTAEAFDQNGDLFAANFSCTISEN